MILRKNDIAFGAVLVTGASGFLGSRIVARISELGVPVRALVRKTSRIDHLQLPGVTIFYGDVSDAESIKPAFEQVEYVIHTAADTSGSEEGGQLSTIQGTMNVLALSELCMVKRLVHISTCNVYGVADYVDGQVVDEDAPLERFPEKRGYYTHSKLAAENLVTEEMKKGKLPIVCLRPGTIFGPGGNIYTPMIGFSMGEKIFVVIGNGKFVLPLVYVDNLVEAVLLAMNSSISVNKIYNVVDPVKVTKRDYLEKVIKVVYVDSFIIYFPFTLLKMLVYFQERLCLALKMAPFLSRYRLISSQKAVFYDSSLIVNDLGWNSPITVETAFNNLIAYEKDRAQ